jgi:hypothetical protein
LRRHMIVLWFDRKAIGANEIGANDDGVRLNRLVWISYYLPCSAQLQVLEKELESRLQVSVCFRFWIELGILLDSLSIPCARCGVNSAGVFRPSSLLSIVVDTMNLNL